MLCLLLQAHREFEVVTPRNLDTFSGDLLILPDVKCLSRAELASLGMLVRTGKALMLTGETGKFDERRRAQPANPLHRLLGISDPSRKQSSKLIYDPECPGKTYYAALEKDFNDSALRSDSQSAPFNRLREDFIKEISPTLTSQPAVIIDASPFISTQIARISGRVHVFLANFKGLKAREVAEQTPEKDVRITFFARCEKVHMLPFLGDVQDLRCGTENGRTVCFIPEIKKGVVVWFEEAR